MDVSEVYALTAELLLARGLSSIKDRPGLTVQEIDNLWAVAINPHRDEIDSVPPYHMLFEFNGWPAGLVSPTGGPFAAGSAANEDALLAALRAALEEA